MQRAVWSSAAYARTCLVDDPLALAFDSVRPQLAAELLEYSPNTLRTKLFGPESSARETGTSAQTRSVRGWHRARTHRPHVIRPRLAGPIKIRFECEIYDDGEDK